MVVKSQDGPIVVDLFIATVIFSVLTLVDMVSSNEAIILPYADQYIKHSD